MKIREWLRANYDSEQIAEIAKHGCISGVSGLTYYTETVAFHDEHEEEIWDLLEEDRESQGYKTILELIATFGGARDVGSMDQFKNLLCWYAVEREAFYISEGLYDEPEKVKLDGENL